MSALPFFIFEAYTVYGPIYANASYPTSIKVKVGHLPWLGRGVMSPPEAWSSVQWNPGMESRTRIRMMGLFLPGMADER